MEYQYTIQVQLRDAKSYHINTYDNLDVALNHLDSYIKKDNQYKRTYYVFNDFFDNKFTPEVATSKYQLLYREVGDWNKFHNLQDFIKNSLDKEYLL